MGRLWEDESLEMWFLEHGAPPSDMPTDCDAGTVTVDVLPTTCTLEKMLRDDDGCSFQVDLTSVVGADLQLLAAVGKCPSSLLPFVSLSVAGTAANDLLAPCATDSDCATGHTCFDLAKAVFSLDSDESFVRSRLIALKRQRSNLCASIENFLTCMTVLRVVACRSGTCLRRISCNK